MRLVRRREVSGGHVCRSRLRPCGSRCATTSLRGWRASTATRGGASWWISFFFFPRTLAVSVHLCRSTFGVATGQARAAAPFTAGLFFNSKTGVLCGSRFTRSLPRRPGPPIPLSYRPDCAAGRAACRAYGLGSWSWSLWRLPRLCGATMCRQPLRSRVTGLAERAHGQIQGRRFGCRLN